MPEINSYESLAAWLVEDLGSITDTKAIDDVRSYLASCGQVHPALHNAIERLDAEPSCEAKMRILNESLRSLFCSEAFPLESYQEHLDSLSTGEELANRLKARNPLPTIDVLVQFEADARSLTQCARAAIVTSAAIALHRAGERGGGTAAVLGGTLVPGLERDSIAYATGERVLVLARGVAYVLDLESGALDLGALEAALEWIKDDAFTRTPSGLLPLVTAARRATCFQIRRLLEQHPRNTGAFEEVESCLFAVCLDDGSSPADLEALCRRMFGNRENRWYGMTCFVLDEAAELAIIASYGRGIDGVPGLVFCDALRRKILETPVPVSRGSRTIEARRVDFHPVVLGEWEDRARTEIASTFHNQQCFWTLDIGSEFFLSHNLSANPILNYLIMLAAHETYGLQTLPALSHAVAGRGGTSTGGNDWVVVSTSCLEQLCAATTEAEWFTALTDASTRHADRANRSRRGYSPSFFMRGPRTESDRKLFELFQLIGERYSTGYRSYLFRPTRWPNTMDILTSTLVLPEGIRYIGRAGATSDVASMFGAHVIVGPEQTSLFMLPGWRSDGRLAEFHANLERMIARFRAAAKHDLGPKTSTAIGNPMAAQ